MIKYLVILLPLCIFANNDEGSVSGTVLGNGVPLIGANVFLEGTTLGSTTDSLGNYFIDKIPIGKYIIRVDFVGYNTIKKDIYISMKDADDFEYEASSFNEKLGLETDTLYKSIKGKTLIDLDFYLESTALDLDQIVVSAAKVKQKEQKNYLDTARYLMQDTGIKTKIIKQYLPIMNQLINKNLADMDFFVNFTLDDEFNETIKSRHRDEFNYHSFSEGEKLRIDLAILFTWREIAKLKNSTNTNLLILDEIFDSSLDASGTDEFMRILSNKLAKENVFVISHKGDTLLDKFPSVLKFEKYKNFTRMA